MNRTKWLIPPIAVGATLLVTGLLALSSIYWCNTDERIAYMHFGKVVAIREPGGPYFKWPVVDATMSYPVTVQLINHQENKDDILVVTKDHFQSSICFYATWQSDPAEISWRIANYRGTGYLIDALVRANIKENVAHRSVEGVSAQLVDINNEVLDKLKRDVSTMYHVNMVDFKITNFTPDEKYTEAVKIRTLGDAQAAALAAFQGPLQSNPALLSLQEINRWDGHRSTVASPAASPLVTVPAGQ